MTLPTRTLRVVLVAYDDAAGTNGGDPFYTFDIRHGKRDTICRATYFLATDDRLESLQILTATAKKSLDWAGPPMLLAAKAVVAAWSAPEPVDGEYDVDYWLSAAFKNLTITA